MEQLSYEALRRRHYSGYLLDRAPERVLQFGEGNFLRGFADYFIDVMNERVNFQSKVVVVPPASAGKTGRINSQEGLYQLCLRGRLDGAAVDQRRVISCISRAVDVYEAYEAFLETARNPDMRLIISNTTEAGIVYDPSCTPEDRPPASFPAKLTRLLWERYQAGLPGYLILPCELIADNGAVLRDYVLRHARDWALGEGFLRWLEEENTFCSTLVDRIVTGYPREQADAMNRAFGLEDRLLDVAEPFGLWVIEGPEELAEQFPAPQAGLPVKFVPDHHPYKEQKVRILNGGHTAMVAAAYLAGHDIVRDSMADPAVRAYLEGALLRRSSQPSRCPGRTVRPSPGRWRSALTTPISTTGFWILPSTRSPNGGRGYCPAWRPIWRDSARFPAVWPSPSRPCAHFTARGAGTVKPTRSGMIRRCWHFLQSIGAGTRRRW